MTAKRRDDDGGDGELIFAEETSPAGHAADGWKILIVDDDRQTHEVTRLT